MSAAGRNNLLASVRQEVQGARSVEPLSVGQPAPTPSGRWWVEVFTVNADTLGVKRLNLDGVAVGDEFTIDKDETLRLTTLATHFPPDITESTGGDGNDGTATGSSGTEDTFTRPPYRASDEERGSFLLIERCPISTISPSGFIDCNISGRQILGVPQ